MRQLHPAELKAWLDDPGQEKPLLLDVREPWEFDVCRIEGSRLLPMRSLPAHLDELDRARENEVSAEANIGAADVKPRSGGRSQIVVICHHGVRSFHAGRFLEHSGFTNVINLTGGVDAWAKEVDHAMPTY